MMRRLLKEALWAPLAILVLNAIVTRTPDARDLYWLLHVLGGAALGFFYSRTLVIVGPLLGELRPLGRYVAAFLLACATALAWEIGEFAIDQVAGTMLQEDLLDTMTDLLFGISGAAFYLAFAALTDSAAGPGGR